MNFLICGLGSIGQRHVRNLKIIQPNCQIIAFRKTKKNLEGFEKKFDIKTVYSLKQAFPYKLDAVFITNPTSLHIPLALSCTKEGLDLFIEKPLSHSWEGINEFEKIIKKKNLIVMVGFMMRYNPGIIKIKNLLEEETIGNIVSAQIVNGEYLPSWHPWENYRKSYSARKNLGGGIILNFSHELDYASWFFGSAENIYCLTGKVKSLKTDVEDSADILVKYKNGVKTGIHLDHISQPPIRTISIIGEKGRIFWDYYKATVEWYNPNKNKWQAYKYAFDRNAMFLNELKDFLNCIETRKIPFNNFASAKENLKITLATKKSAITNKPVSL